MSDPCESKYMTYAGEVVECAYSQISHPMHEGKLGEDWFTWRTEHEINQKTYGVPPKEPVVTEVPSVTDTKLHPFDVIDAWKLDFYEGSALQYLLQHRENNGAEDVRKAIHYLELLLERQYKND